MYFFTNSTIIFSIFIKSPINLVLFTKKIWLFQLVFLLLQLSSRCNTILWWASMRTYIQQALSDALVLTCQNFANSQLLVKNKATTTPHGVYYIQPSLASDTSVFVTMRVTYIFTSAWGFDRCSFRQEGAMRRP